MIVLKEFRVGFLDIDKNLKIKNRAILNLFEEIAGVHAEKIGDGFGSSELRWILTGYKINVIKRPKHGDDVTVATWSSDYNPAIATREFELRDKEGHLLVTGISGWVLVDYSTKRLAKITPDYMKRYDTEFDRSNYESSRLPKLIEPSSYSSSHSILIDWKWMDMNNHMNNTYYTEIAEHFLPEEDKEVISDCDFQILYKKEIPENTKIKLLYSKTDDAYTVVFKSEDETILYTIINYIR